MQISMRKQEGETTVGVDKKKDGEDKRVEGKKKKQMCEKRS